MVSPPFVDIERTMEKIDEVVTLAPPSAADLKRSLMRTLLSKTISHNVLCKKDVPLRAYDGLIDLRATACNEHNFSYDKANDFFTIVSCRFLSPAE